jgi:hypothetical protein
LLLVANRIEVDLKRVLWQLAYEAHGQSSAVDHDKLADIGELRLQKALAGLNSGDLNWAQQLIETMKLRAGLLIERATRGLMPRPGICPRRRCSGSWLSRRASSAWAVIRSRTRTHTKKSNRRMRLRCPPIGWPAGR